MLQARLAGVLGMPPPTDPDAVITKGGGPMGADDEEREEYFGRPLVDRATGRENIEAVNRKNSDAVARNRERNRELADVFLARSTGGQRLRRATKEQLDDEKAIRSRAQKVQCRFSQA